jgi:hypothetical protein
MRAISSLVNCTGASAAVAPPTTHAADDATNAKRAIAQRVDDRIDEYLKPT